MEVIGPHRERAIEQDEIAGYEMNLFGYRVGNMWRQAPYVTANVNLWPQMFAIIGHPDRVASLSGDQHEWLTRAVQQTAAASTELIDGDAGLIGDLCEEGARFANASDADVEGLRDAFAEVYTDLRRDPETAQFIAEIEGLRGRNASPAVAIPDGCTGPAPDSAAQPSVQPSKTTTVTDLDGTWEVTFTEGELAATDGVDPSEIGPELAGTFVVTFDRGDITGPVKPGEAPPAGLTYFVEGDTFTIYAEDASMGGAIPPIGPGIWKYRWSAYGDTLTFEKLGGQEPGCSLSVSKGMCEPSVFVVKPWHRIG
jgi:hypothetical protein